MKKLLIVFVLFGVGLFINLSTHASELEYEAIIENNSVVFTGEDVIINYSVKNVTLVKLNGSTDPKYALDEDDYIITSNSIIIKASHFYKELSNNADKKMSIFSYWFASEPFNERGSTHNIIGLIFIDLQSGKEEYTHSDPIIKSHSLWLREIRNIKIHNLDKISRLAI